MTSFSVSGARGPFVLAGDLGGTSCRLALAGRDSAGRSVILDRLILPAKDLRSAADLHRAAEARWGQALGSLRSAALALAGPVTGRRARLVNADLDLAADEAEALFGCPVRLLNDFTALAFAVAGPAGREAERLAGGAGTDGVRAVAGAGTGFGCAALLPGGVPLASEAGHMPFALEGDEERAFGAFLAERLGRDFPETDDVVSGRGLAALADFLTGGTWTSREAEETFLTGAGNPVFGLFARLYARACRSFVLAVLATGGLWIAGGIALRRRELARSEAFRTEFCRGVHGGLLARIPVFLFADESCGLQGAVQAAWETV